jgi:hypothetical protein
MDIPVLVEELPDRRFRARSGEPFGLTAEGATSDEALGNLDRLMRATLENGTRLMTVRLPAADENPWIAGAGCLKDDPLFDEWQEAIAEYRRKVDADPSA